MFGPRGPASILQRATTLVAVLFMATSITLALYSNKAMLANANVDDEFENIARERELEKSPDAPAPVAPAPEAPEIAPSLEAPQ